MNNFTITVECPALEKFTATLLTIFADKAAAPVSAQPATPPTPFTPALAPVTPMISPAVPTIVPTANPIQTQVPVTSSVPAQTAVASAPAPVPTAAAPTYNRDQIMTAGAALIDTGKINELMGLLGSFGVQAVTQLGQEQLGAFATELRKLGAQI